MTSIGTSARLGCDLRDFSDEGLEEELLEGWTSILRKVYPGVELMYRRRSRLRLNDLHPGTVATVLRNLEMGVCYRCSANKLG